MTASTSTPRTAPRVRRVRPREQYWDFRTADWRVAPPTVPSPREGDRPQASAAR
jgi:hypothetical protein